MTEMSSDEDIETLLSLPPLSERLATTTKSNEFHKGSDKPLFEKQVSGLSTSNEIEETLSIEDYQKHHLYDVEEGVLIRSESQDETECWTSHSKKSRKDRTTKKLAVSQEKERKRQEKLEERQKKMAEKERLKAIKNAEKAVKKAVKPGENLKYVTVFLDANILNLWKNSEIIVQLLNDASIQFKFGDNLLPNSVVWEKKSIQHLVSEDGKVKENVTTITEDYVLIVVRFSEFLERMVGADQSLRSYVADLRNLFNDKRITLFITGMAAYFRSTKAADNRHFRDQVRDTTSGTQGGRRSKKVPCVSREEIEDLLVQLELEYMISHVEVDSSKDFAQFVGSYTKAIADKEYKLNERQASFTFYSSSDMATDVQAVKVDESGTGLSRLWVNQLRQLPTVGLDAAHAIAAVYPLPLTLRKAYTNCPDLKKAQLLLQDIVVRRGAGALTSTRRVGPELSKKLHKLITSTDGNVSL